MVSAAVLAANLARVRERVAAAASRAGRDPAGVTIMAVTKGQPAGALRLAYDAGLRLIGENRVQEAEGKLHTLPPGCEAHLIGHLQRNKAGRAARLFSCVHSIDTLETAQALSRGAVAASRIVEVLLEKNTSGEESQAGYRDDGQLLQDLAAVAALPGLRVRGLMTIAPQGPEAAVRAAFAQVRQLLERARDVEPGLNVLSMGMSGDFEQAIEEGATIVRLGTTLFGARTDA
jgi:PLP dependent protein